MANKIQVNTQSLGSDANTMNTALTAIRNSMKSVFEAVSELDRMWDGPANEAFNAEFKKDKETMDKQCTSVEKLIECMNSAKKDYEKCENQVQSAVSAIRC